MASSVTSSTPGGRGGGAPAASLSTWSPPTALVGARAAGTEGGLGEARTERGRQVPGGGGRSAGGQARSSSPRSLPPCSGVHPSPRDTAPQKQGGQAPTGCQSLVLGPCPPPGACPPPVRVLCPGSLSSIQEHTLCSPAPHPAPFSRSAPSPCRCAPCSRPVYTRTRDPVTPSRVTHCMPYHTRARFWQQV